MTNEEKAKAYDMAIEAARKELGVDRKEWEVVARVLHNIFPELADSEDERIRKMCIAAVNIAASADGGLLHSEASECLAWLEEQKDKNCLACDQHLKGYIAGRKVTEEEKQKENPKNADSIPEDCVSLAKCEDRDSKYGVFPEDVIVVARACEKLEAHGYSELAHALKNVNLYTKPVDYDHEMWKNCEANFEGGKKEVIDHPEKYGLQKEQKPQGVYVDCTEHPEWYGMPPKEQKPIQSDDEKEYVRVLKSLISDFIRDNYKTTDISFYQKIYDWLDGRHIEQKPAEWSEEDDQLIGFIFDLLNDLFWRKDWAMSKEECLERLQSLRPQKKEDLAKMLQDEYEKGREYGERIGHTKGFNKGYKVAEEEYRNATAYKYSVPPSGIWCDGTHCINPHHDCVNCPTRYSSSGTITTPNSATIVDLPKED